MLSRATYEFTEKLSNNQVSHYKYEIEFIFLPNIR